MKIFIGTDHRGVEFKKKIISLLEKEKVDIVDLGAFDDKEASDYPKVAFKVASHVAKTKNSRGILLCMSGIGQAIAANKIKGAYAALCYNPEAAILCRAHNNANILVLGAKFVEEKDIPLILKNFLTTSFEGGRHLRRFKQMQMLEKGLKLK